MNQTYFGEDHTITFLPNPVILSGSITDYVGSAGQIGHNPVPDMQYSESVTSTRGPPRYRGIAGVGSDNNTSTSSTTTAGATTNGITIASNTISMSGIPDYSDSTITIPTIHIPVYDPSRDWPLTGTTNTIAATTTGQVLTATSGTTATWQTTFAITGESSTGFSGNLPNMNNIITSGYGHNNTISTSSYGYATTTHPNQELYGLQLVHTELKSKIENIRSEIKELEDNYEIEEKRLQMLIKYKSKRLEEIKDIETIRDRHMQLINDMQTSLASQTWLRTETDTLQDLQDISKGMGYPCPVCQVNIINRVVGCGHPFCHKCLNELKKELKQCPICKKDLSVIVPLYL